MADLPGATGAHSEISINGTVYKLAPLTISDLGQVTQWVKDSIIESGMRAAEKSQNKRMLKLIVDAAFEDARKVQFAVEKNGNIETSPEVEAFLKSPDGAMRLLHISVAQNHEITLEQLGRQLDINDISPAIMKLMQISGFGVDAAASGVAGSGGKSETKPD